MFFLDILRDTRVIKCLIFILTRFLSRVILFFMKLAPFNENLPSPNNDIFGQHVLPYLFLVLLFQPFFYLGDNSSPFLEETFVSPPVPSSPLTSFDTTNSSSRDSSPIPKNVPKTRNKRQTWAPAYLDQYHCYLLNQTPSFPAHPNHSTSYPILAFLSYDKFDASYRNFLFSITTVTAPKTFREAILLDEFKGAMKSETDSLEGTGTWSICQMPLGKHPVGCKWVNT